MTMHYKGDLEYIILYAHCWSSHSHPAKFGPVGTKAVLYEGDRHLFTFCPKCFPHQVPGLFKVVVKTFDIHPLFPFYESRIQEEKQYPRRLRKSKLRNL